MMAVTFNYSLPNNASLSSMEVMDPLSRKIIEQPLTTSTGKISLDVSQWNAGVYFYRIINKETASEFKKMVVE